MNIIPSDSLSSDNKSQFDSGNVDFPPFDHGAGDEDSRSDEDLVHITEQEILHVLQHGEMEEVKMLPYSSNYNLLTVVKLNEIELPAVYKPQRGENPLWDFARGTLCKREAAAYVVNLALGWTLVPPTILRNGGYGIGSVQLYIEHDDREHYFTVQEDARYATSFRKLALFDFITNNADRKSGHCLIDIEGRLWAIDHGICFHEEYKLRTVIWEFGGSPIDDDLAQDLTELRGSFDVPSNSYIAELSQLLSSDEQFAMIQRLDLLLESGTYPTPLPHRRNYPWPPV